MYTYKRYKKYILSVLHHNKSDVKVPVFRFWDAHPIPLAAP